MHWARAQANANHADLVERRAQLGDPQTLLRRGHGTQERHDFGFYMDGMACLRPAVALRFSCWSV
jgi:hypothetical protein